MTSKLTVKKTAIDQARSALVKAPPKEKEVFDLREAIAELRQEIEGILAKGYSFDEVSELMSQSGIEIKGVSLKQYLAALRRKDTKKKSSRRRSEKTGQETKAKPIDSVNTEPVIAQVEPETDLQQLEDSTQIENKPESVRNTRKASQRSSSFVEIAEDL